MRPAVLLFELDSVAAGIRTGDAMAKRAPLMTLHSGTVQPGRYLVLAGGDVAAVEEAGIAGREVAAGSLVDEVFLPDVHEDVLRALTGERRAGDGSALGVFETRTVAALLGSADAAVKGALVTLMEIRAADGLGGKAYALFAGEVADVEAAIEIARLRLNDPSLLVGDAVIPQLDDDMRADLLAESHFGARIGRGDA